MLFSLRALPGKRPMGVKRLPLFERERGVFKQTRHSAMDFTRFASSPALQPPFRLSILYEI
jgi:hypothetical protein